MLKNIPEVIKGLSGCEDFMEISFLILSKKFATSLGSLFSDILEILNDPKRNKNKNV